MSRSGSVLLQQHGLRPIALILMLLACGLATAQQRTINEGVFNTQQVNQGKTAYNKYCRDCHSSNLEGGGVEPPLNDSLFIDAWREDYLASLYEYISTRMPKGRKYAAGSLKPQEYLAIVAYILQRNDYPVGASAMTAEDLETVLFVGLDGPAPLPPNAMVRTVGCFTPVADPARLEQAAAPARVRTGDETDDRELAASTLRSLGSLTFRLNNLDVVATQEKVMALSGQKVQIKGVMNGIEDTARIFVLSLEGVGECSL